MGFFAEHKLDWKKVLEDFWQDFSLHDPKDPVFSSVKDAVTRIDEKMGRRGEVLDAINALLENHFFPPREDGKSARLCPACNKGQLAIKAGRTGSEPARSPGRTMGAEPARTLLIDRGDVDQVIQKAEEAAAATAKLDIGTLKPGDVVEGRYKFIEKIGKGAFGTVLLMEDTVVEERLILKFLNPNVAQDEEMMKRFVHELRYSRKITHRNVIRIYDFLFIRGNYAISMEYFPSHTLGNEIGDKPLPLAKAVRFSMDVATGMTVAHDNAACPNPSNCQDDYAVWTVTFNVTNPDGNVMMLLGGHTAQGAGNPRGWGAGVGSGSVSGGPYHFKWEELDGASVGNRDNQIQSGALVPPTNTPTPTNTPSAKNNASAALKIGLPATL